MDLAKKLLTGALILATSVVASGCGHLDRNYTRALGNYMVSGTANQLGRNFADDMTGNNPRHETDLERDLRLLNENGWNSSSTGSHAEITSTPKLKCVGLGKDGYMNLIYSEDGVSYHAEKRFLGDDGMWDSEAPTPKDSNGRYIYYNPSDDANYAVPKGTKILCD